MRDNGVLKWLLVDHLGSTSRVANTDGTSHSDARYKVYGEVRYTSGKLPTKYTFTEQYSEDYINMNINMAEWVSEAAGL